MTLVFRPGIDRKRWSPQTLEGVAGTGLRKIQTLAVIAYNQGMRRLGPMADDLGTKFQTGFDDIFDDTIVSSNAAQEAASHLRALAVELATVIGTEASQALIKKVQRRAVLRWASGIKKGGLFNVAGKFFGTFGRAPIPVAPMAVGQAADQGAPGPSESSARELAEDARYAHYWKTFGRGRTQICCSIRLPQLVARRSPLTSTEEAYFREGLYDLDSYESRRERRLLLEGVAE